MELINSEKQLKELYPEYKLLKISYQNGVCLLGDTPLEVDKFYDIITPDTIKQGNHYSGDGWEGVYVSRDKGKLTPYFIGENPFGGRLKKTILRGGFGSKIFLMKLNPEMNKLEEECEELDSQLGWGNFNGYKI